MDYECYNGLVGMNRYVILKIIKIIKERGCYKKIYESVVRNIIAIEHYMWIKLDIFTWVVRPQIFKLPVMFSPRKVHENVLYCGNKIEFPEKGNTASLDCECKIGLIYALDLIIKGWMYFGVALKSLFPGLYQESQIGMEGMCVAETIGNIYLHGTRFYSGFVCRISDNCRVRVELDFTDTTHHLHFFEGDNECSHVITNLPHPSTLQLVVGNRFEYKSAAMIVSLRSMLSTAAHAVSDRDKKYIHKWK